MTTRHSTVDNRVPGSTYDKLDTGPDIMDPDARSTSSKHTVSPATAAAHERPHVDRGGPVTAGNPSARDVDVAHAS